MFNIDKFTSEADDFVIIKAKDLREGGSGSGNWGHSGRPGEIGGSSSADSRSDMRAQRERRAQGILAHARQKYGIKIDLKFVDSIPVKIKVNGKTKVVQAQGRVDPNSGELLINKSIFDEPGKLSQVGPQESSTLRMGWQSVVYHEIGHKIDLKHKLTDSKQFKIVHNTMVVNMMNKGVLKSGFVSQYAMQDMAENFAESFATYQMNPGWLAKNNLAMYNYVRSKV